MASLCLEANPGADRGELKLNRIEEHPGCTVYFITALTWAGRLCNGADFHGLEATRGLFLQSEVGIDMKLKATYVLRIGVQRKHTPLCHLPYLESVRMLKRVSQLQYCFLEFF